MASRVGAGSASSRVSSTGEVSGPPQGGGSCLLWEAAAVCRVSARLEETGLRCCSGAAWPAPSVAGGPPGVTCWRATAGAGGMPGLSKACVRKLSPCDLANSVLVPPDMRTCTRFSGRHPHPPHPSQVDLASSGTPKTVWAQECQRPGFKSCLHHTPVQSV